METLHKQSDSFFTGLSGLQLKLPQYLFPSPFENASRLTYYASIFNTIEINSSFYKIPNPATVAKWAESVDENFKFSFKLLKRITHNKELLYNQDDLTEFFSSINMVNTKKGCLLIQIPSSLDNKNIHQLDKLLTSIQEINSSHKWKIAVEFRNSSWYQDKTSDLINSHNAAFVIHDKTKSETPYFTHKSKFIYIRFHGPSGNHRDSYSEDFLSKNSGYIQEFIEEGKEVFTYFNNTMGDAYDNSKTLNSLFENKLTLA